MPGSFLYFVGKISDSLGVQAAFSRVWGTRTPAQGEDGILFPMDSGHAMEILKGDFHIQNFIIPLFWCYERKGSAVSRSRWSAPAKTAAPQISHLKHLAGCWEMDELMLSQPWILRTLSVQGQGLLFPWWHPGILAARSNGEWLEALITKQYSKLSPCLAITEHSSWNGSGNLQCELKESCSFLI